MKIDFTEDDRYVTIVNGYHRMVSFALINRHWVNYKSDAIRSKSLSLFFLNLN